MTVVAFVYTDWNTRYPEFATTVNATQAADCFLQATLYLDNTDNSIVTDIPTRTMLLYMLTSHIAQISYGSSLQANSSAVGRIDSATQGSVSVSYSAPTGNADVAWFLQTKYGANYWRASARWRSAIYVRPPRPPRSFPRF